jgi:protein-tyrosine phosphatase
VIDFFKKRKIAYPIIEVDIHSHLIPGVDDGSQSFEESLSMLKKFASLGYKKIITTPHIMTDFYNNTESQLKLIHKDLVVKIEREGIDIDLQLAAEYYLDDRLFERIEDPKEEFLTFGNGYLLFETSFMNEPFYLKDFIFKAKSRGIKPILAHPERYAYLQNNDSLIEDLINRELLFQVNINSISGYYSKQVKTLARKLIDYKNVHFIGSDCHNQRHLEVLEETRTSKYYAKALSLPLKNFEL